MPELDSNSVYTVAHSYSDIKRKWASANRGVFTRVAKQLKPSVTPEAVRRVYWGLSKSKRVERALIRVGAPIGPKWIDYDRPAAA